MSYEQEKQVAIEAVRAASSLCQQVRGTITPEALEKKDRSPVTIADFGSQAIVCRAIAAAFPSDPIVGEEDAAELRKPAMAEKLAQVTQYVQQVVSEATPELVTTWIDRGNGQVGPRFWTLDPIDGTKGFLRGDQYAVALALIDDGEVKVGVLGCPALSLDNEPPGLIFAAVRGEGTVMIPMQGGDPQSIQVVSPDDSENLRFVESVESGHGDQAQQSAVAKAAGIVQPSLRMDSQAKYGVLAAGKAALYLRLPSPKSPDYRENIWDHAAGAIVVEEAGGRVSDMYGQMLEFPNGAKLVNNRGVIASNGAIHDAVLSALREA